MSYLALFGDFFSYCVVIPMMLCVLVPILTYGFWFILAFLKIPVIPHGRPGAVYSC